MRNAGLGGNGLINQALAEGKSSIIQWALGTFNDCGTIRILTYSRRFYTI